MADDKKAVGPLAAAKLVALIKSETAKKYDKTGGKIEGNAEITGFLNVGMSAEFSSSINAGSEITSDMLLMAPIVALRDPATGKSISFGVSGENAAKVTSPVSGGGTQYARLAVGTPTGDNDAATKKYVDDHAGGGSSVTVDTAMSDTSTNAVQNKVIKKYVDDHGAANAVLYTAQSLNFEQKQRARKNIGAAASEVPTITGGVSLCPANVTDNNDAVHLTTTKYSGDDFTLTLDCGPENALVRVKGIRTPTDADTDAAANVEYVKTKISEVSASGGVIVDTAMSNTSTNPVQNKVVKSALDGKLDKTGGTLTGNLTGKYITGTWLQTTEATDLGRVPGKIAVLDDSGWVYYRTPSEILNDIGGASKEYVDDHATGGATKVTISGTIEGEVSGYTSATYQQIVNEISKNCNIWLTIDGETIRLASWKRSGSAAYKLVFFGAGSGALTVKYEVTASASSATLTVTGG